MEVKHVTDQQMMELLDGIAMPNEIQIRLHVDTCEKCQLLMEQYERLYDGLGQPVEAELSPNFAARMADRFEAEYNASRQSSLWERTIWSSLGVAAALALYFFLDWSTLLQSVAQNDVWQSFFSKDQLNAWANTLAGYNLDPSILIVGLVATVIFGNMDTIFKYLRDRHTMCC